MTRLPLLSREVLISESLVELPERAVQFGTGALLRGLVDATLDDANRAGLFNGRIVAIGSTGSGRDQQLNRQDGLFTLLVRGGPVQHRIVVSAVSRAICALDEWEAVLECARNPLLEVIFSNTTEVGIAVDESDMDDGNGDEHATIAPRSFPAKLARFLIERARAFDSAPERGLVVIPCELIDRNGDTLRQLVLGLTREWKVDAGIRRWLEASVRFCNTLVDRIVPGAPSQLEHARLERELGYHDALLTVCEPYRLLAIEGDAELRARLSFARPEFGVTVVDDITPYRDRKVRLLNGAHTVVAPLALLAGCETVRDAVEHEYVGPFLRRALLEELVPAVDVAGADAFALEVLERFANPHVEHRLRDITLHGGAKVRVRLVPAIQSYFARNGRAASSLALGLAAYVLYAGQVEPLETPEESYTISRDEVGERVRARWSESAAFAQSDDGVRDFAREICADAQLWGARLDSDGFSDCVAEHLVRLVRRGAVAALGAHLATMPNPSQRTAALT